MSKDLWDLPLSTESPRAAEQYGLAVSYGEDWWFLNVHGFACTEADKRTRGRRLVDRALALNPRNAHAAHARAHVCYEGNASEEGAAFLRST